eukprot:TRINITY_DN14455_c0_g1_i5.p1 TRINITY_DN14455_c0_g1~~TRINITY_DN14455_c0_g1_i5.p1  ORF type:complete len:371 (-),score=88.08 TRINITY_DN14455_c0_g1_i5:89-1201(-)
MEAAREWHQHEGHGLLLPTRPKEALPVVSEVCGGCQRCLGLSWNQNGFDHHCYYLNTCICDKNYNQFIVMLTSLFLMIAIQVVFGILVLFNYFDNDLQVGKFAGSLDNQKKVMNDIWGTELFCTLVFFMLAVGGYALWFVGDLLHLHFYFIYRSCKQERRFTTLDYLHEQRMHKKEAAIQAARAQYGDNPRALEQAVLDEEDHYLYNRANYLYHDEIDMTGKEELNIQHGSAPQHVEHLAEESGGLHCFKAVGLQKCCYALSRCTIKSAGMNTAQDERAYYDEALERAEGAGPEGDVFSNPEVVEQMYRDMRASVIDHSSALPPQYDDMPESEGNTIHTLSSFEESTALPKSGPISVQVEDHIEDAVTNF